MTDFDLAMITLVAAASLWGAYVGFVRQATTLGAWSVGIVAATLFRQPVAAWIGGTAPANEIGAAIIILFATSLVVHLFGGQMRAWIESADLQGFDHQTGFMLGAAKGVALATLVTIASYHLHEPSRATIADSLTARYVANIVDRVEPFVPPPAGQWVVKNVKEPFDAMRVATPAKQPRRFFVASRPKATR